MDDDDRRKILDRADRMLKQSQLLRKMADELLQESDDIRRSTIRATKGQAPKKPS